MSKNFGLPYMGSKNRIAKELITELIWNEPNAQIFIDFFAGVLLSNSIMSFISAATLIILNCFN